MATFPPPPQSPTTPNRRVKTVLVVGGNLFALAARELGDATQWNRIARLNGLFDPTIPPTITQLTLPPFDPNAGNGGIMDGAVITGNQSLQYSGFSPTPQQSIAQQQMTMQTTTGSIFTLGTSVLGGPDVLV
jgi:hypothetical protein